MQLFISLVFYAWSNVTELIGKYFSYLLILFIAISSMVNESTNWLQWIIFGVAGFAVFIGGSKKLSERTVRKALPAWRFFIETVLFVSFSGVYIGGLLKDAKIISDGNSFYGIIAIVFIVMAITNAVISIQEI